MLNFAAQPHAVQRLHRVPQDVHLQLQSVRKPVHVEQHDVDNYEHYDHVQPMMEEDEHREVADTEDRVVEEVDGQDHWAGEHPADLSEDEHGAVSALNVSEVGRSPLRLAPAPAACGSRI